MGRSLPDSDSHRVDKLFWAVVAGASALGLALRVYRLGAPSLSIDETLSWALAGRVGDLARGFQSPVYHPVLKLWVALLGDSAGAMRSLSVIFGVAAIPVGAWFGRALSGRVYGAVCALLLAAHPWLVAESRIARPYALAALLVTVAFALCVRLSTRERDFAGAGALAAVNAVGVFTSYPFAWMLIGQALFLGVLAGPAVFRRRDVQTGLVAPVAAALLGSPLIYAQARVLAEHMRGFPILTRVIDAPLQNWVTDLGFGAPWIAWMEWGEIASPIVTGIGFLVFIAACVFAVLDHRSDGRSLAVPAAFFGPLAVLVVVSLVVPVWTPHTLTLFTPVLLFAIALLVTRWPTVTTPIVVALALASSLGSAINADACAADRWAWQKPESWRPLTAQLAQHVRVGDQIFVSPGWMTLAIRYHERGTPRTEVEGELPIVEVPFDFYDADADLSDVIGFGAARRIWVVRVAGYPSDNLIRAVERAGFALVEHQFFHRLSLELYARDLTPPGEIEILAPSKEPASALKNIEPIE